MSEPLSAEERLRAFAAASPDDRLDMVAYQSDEIAADILATLDAARATPAALRDAAKTLVDTTDCTLPWSYAEQEEIRSNVLLVEQALAAATPAAPDHAQHYDPDCEECVYLVRTFVHGAASPAAPADVLAALAAVGLPSTASIDDLIRHHRNNEAATNGAWKIAYDALVAQGAASPAAPEALRTATAMDVKAAVMALDTKPDVLRVGPLVSRLDVLNAVDEAFRAAAPAAPEALE